MYYISCIVPAKNESGRLFQLLDDIISVPEIKQILIIEGGSSDDTFEKATEIQEKYPNLVFAIKQSGTGKFNAVIEAAKICQQANILIWDADGTVPLYSTRKLIEFASKHDTSVIGNRLAGKIEKGAMRKANFLANWAFALIWSPYHGIFGADMLCGTKLFKKEVFLDIPLNWLPLDPYGDFVLVANSVRLGHKLSSIPVDYNARSYGETNIKRWSGGWQLLKLTILLYLKSKESSKKLI